MKGEALMNENNENFDKKEETAVYCSDVVMTRDAFYDFNSVSYKSIKNMFLICLCLAVYNIAMSILSENYEGVFLMLLIAVIFAIAYFIVGLNVKRNYERNLLSLGKEADFRVELFEDKIISGDDARKREFSYNQVTKFCETKQFLLLHLQHQLYITINKNSLHADVGEVKEFLLRKCTLVKKKKFVNCANDKKLALIFLILLLAFSVIGTVAAIVLFFNDTLFWI